MTGKEGERLDRAFPRANNFVSHAHAVRGLTALGPDPERRLQDLDFADIDAALDENERLGYRLRYPETVAQPARLQVQVSIVQPPGSKHRS